MLYYAFIYFVRFNSNTVYITHNIRFGQRMEVLKRMPILSIRLVHLYIYIILRPATITGLECIWRSRMHIKVSLDYIPQQTDYWLNVSHDLDMTSVKAGFPPALFPPHPI